LSIAPCRFLAEASTGPPSRLMHVFNRLAPFILYWCTAMRMPLVFVVSICLLPPPSEAHYLAVPTDTQSQPSADHRVQRGSSQPIQETAYDASVRLAPRADGQVEWGRPESRFSVSMRETSDIQSVLSQQRLAASWAFPLKSTLQVAYVRGTLKEAVLQPLPSSQSQAIESTFGYRRAAVSLQARSAYVQHEQWAGTPGTSNRQEHWLTASYELWPTLTLSSQLGWQEQGRARRPSTSVILSYRPLSTVAWTMSSRYSAIDGAVDANKMDATCMLSWRYHEISRFAATLTVEQTYTAALTGTTADAFATLLQLRLSGDGWVERLREFTRFRVN
jgi:hypothetical protein